LSYQPNPIQESSELAHYLNNELIKIADNFRNLEVDSVGFKVWNTTPDKPRTGQAYYADGTNWNPGSGEGLYIYKSSATWVFLG
jgi:hypothetical protein